MLSCQRSSVLQQSQQGGGKFIFSPQTALFGLQSILKYVEGVPTFQMCGISCTLWVSGFS